MAVKIKEELTLEDNIRKYLKIVSHNIAEKLQFEVTHPETI